MGFNYAKEKTLFEKEWKKLRKEYEAAGMCAADIESVHAFDWEVFLSRRTYENHTQPLPDVHLSGEDVPLRSALFKKYSSLSTSFGIEDFHGRYDWLDSISDMGLYRKLTALSARDLELLTFIILEGHDQCDLAKKWGCTQSAISQRFKKIKKFLK